ncbi:MAG: transporter [Bacteroidales bacterium]|nr:transporter [Bacteroidales bacterium]MDD2425536.1 transporter [Bacteroidales bacterium]MDD3989995.1 transporter [Bacteroidales bacterium]MDD4638179.1 transporter [Bacteroidales bacterium]
MPVAMVAGIVAGYLIPDFILAANKSIPCLIGIMLLISYSRISFSTIRLSRMIIIMLAVQFAGSLLLFLSLMNRDFLLAQQIFICLFCPVAISAPVIVSMLGSKINSLVSFTLFSYMLTALLAPFLLPFAGGDSDLPFFETSLKIASQILPLILLPLFIILIIRRTSPKVHNFLKSNQELSFWLWSLALLLVIGKSTAYVISQPKGVIMAGVTLALVSLVICLAQFAAGHIIGTLHNEPVAATQGLGQKNIALAMWMSFTYLDPMTSVGLAAYSIWQNIINSTQVYFKFRKEEIFHDKADSNQIL